MVELFLVVVVAKECEVDDFADSNFFTKLIKVNDFVYVDLLMHKITQLIHSDMVNIYVSS